jgi:hypothetical protein
MVGMDTAANDEEPARQGLLEKRKTLACGPFFG